MKSAAARGAKDGSERGSYRSGEETRQRLVDAGMALFSRHGFEGASTRQIAAAAGVAIPAITYHFGGKQGLHLACAHDVVARYRTAMGPTLAAIAGRIDAAAPAEARADLKLVVRLLVGMLVPGDRDASWMDFMLREMSASGASHEHLYRHLWQPGLDLAGHLIARGRGADAATATDRSRALLLLSQLSVFSNFRRVSSEYLSAGSAGDAWATALTAELQGMIDRV